MKYQHLVMPGHMAVCTCPIFLRTKKNGTAGEFTRFAWTQNGEDVVTAALQGAYDK